MSGGSLKLLNKNITLDNDSDSEKTPIYKPTKKVRTHIPWIEKYRPRSLSDLVVDECTLTKLKKFIEDRDMPNIIITGVPGIGKTTSILCLIRYLLGPYCKQAVKELNASDDRGIKAVQESIECFCKKKVDMEPIDGRTFAQHKIILLDEADNMTQKAQQLVKTLMESYNNTTRFAFTCNNSSDIIEAIQSRCVILRYRRLSNEQIKQRLETICNVENVSFTDKGLDAIVITAQGDMRRAINNLQLTFNGYKSVIPEHVYKICDRPHPMTIKKIFVSCYKKDLKTALERLENLRDKGYSSSDISLSMINTLNSNQINEIDVDTKMEFLDELSRTALVISKGINTPIQLTGCVAKLCTLRNT